MDSHIPHGQVGLDGSFSVLPPNAVLLIPTSMILSTPTTSSNGQGLSSPPPLTTASSPSPPMVPPIVGHCIFCMRRLVEPGTFPGFHLFQNLNENEWRVVPRASISSDLLSTFNRLLPLIHNKWKWKVDSESAYLKSCTNGNKRRSKKRRKGSKQYRSVKDLPKDFPHLPAMCQCCGDKFQTLDRIMGELNRKIDEIRGVIKSSKKGGVFGWRGDQFEKDLLNNKALTWESKDKTLAFYSGFGVWDMEEDVNVVRNEEREHEIETPLELEIKIEVNEDDMIKQEVEDDDGNFEDDPLNFISPNDEKLAAPASSSPMCTQNCPTFEANNECDSTPVIESVVSLEEESEELPWLVTSSTDYSTETLPISIVTRETESSSRNRASVTRVTRSSSSKSASEVFIPKKKNRKR